MSLGYKKCLIPFIMQINCFTAYKFGTSNLPEKITLTL